MKIYAVKVNDKFIKRYGTQPSAFLGVADVNDASIFTSIFEAMVEASKHEIADIVLLRATPDDVVWHSDMGEMA